MSSYTCNSCLLKFSLAEAQREHMKSDWHRYNLKRRVAQLPPIDETVFTEKVKALALEDEPEKKQKQVTKKEIRRREKEALLEKKRQLLEIAKQNMLNAMQADGTSQQSQESEPQETVSEKAGLEEQQEEELTQEELEEKLMSEKLAKKVDIPQEVCLFCPKRKFSTFEENIDHMFKCHGFYIPEQKYLVDKSGLVKYLSEKIGLGNVCIVCNYQGRSLEAVRAHMLAKNHCHIPYETEDERLEISQFYDFSSTYANFKKEEATPAQNDDDDDDDDDWEDVESDDEANKGSEAEEDDEEEYIPEEYLYDDGTELHLPTGFKVGHRSLQRYYRQKLKPESVLSEGQGTVIAAETRHFATVYDKKQIMTQKRTWQTEVKDKKRDDKRSAKFINNQPHYRDQLLQ